MNTNAKNAIADFTKGAITKQMLVFAAPLFLSNLLQAVYNVVDMIIMGHAKGAIGLSSISIGGDVTNFLTFFAMGFANAGQIIIAQHVGAGQRNRLPKIVGNLFSILFFGALFFALLSFLFREQILHLMNTPEEAWDYTFAYATTCIAGLFFIYGYNVVSAILRGLGDSRHPFMFIATAAIINIGLDVLFVIQFDMGAFGAALATVIGQAVSFIWGILFLYKNRENLCISIKISDFIPDSHVAKMILRLGIPMAIKSAAIQVSKLFINSSVNAYGVVASSASGIESKVSMIMNLIANAINVSCSTMIGQNIGAQKYDRVPKIMRSAFITVLIVAAVFMGIVVFIPEPFFRMFTGDQGVIEACCMMTLLLVIMFAGAALRTPSNGLIDGTGNYKLNFVLALFDGIVNRIGFALLLGSVMGMGWMGYLYGDAIAGTTPFFVAAIYFASGKWRTTKYMKSR